MVLYGSFGGAERVCAHFLTVMFRSTSRPTLKALAIPWSIGLLEWLQIFFSLFKHRVHKSIPFLGVPLQMQQLVSLLLASAFKPYLVFTIVSNSTLFLQILTSFNIQTVKFIKLINYFNQYKYY